MPAPERNQACVGNTRNLTHKYGVVRNDTVLKTAVLLATLATLIACCASNTPKSAFARYAAAVQRRDAATVLVLDENHCREAAGLKSDREAAIRRLEFRLASPASTRYFGGSLDSMPYTYRLYFPPDAVVEVIDVAQTSADAAEIEATVLYPQGHLPVYVRERKKQWFENQPAGFFVEPGHWVLDLLGRGDGPKLNLSSTADEYDSLVLRARMVRDAHTGRWVVGWVSAMRERSRYRAIDLSKPDRSR